MPLKCPCSEAVRPHRKYEMNHDSPPQLRIPIGAVATVAVVSALCIVLYLVILFASIGWHFRQALKEFPKRHLEATQPIERTYAYFREHGRWPTNADVERGGQRWLPPGWEYESDPELEGPVISRDGPEHMTLVYYFAPPQPGVVDNTWTLSVEGDKRTFPADVGYSLQPAPEPRRP
jgi:hypothetical protein